MRLASLDSSCNACAMSGGKLIIGRAQQQRSGWASLAQLVVEDGAEPERGLAGLAPLATNPGGDAARRELAAAAAVAVDVAATA